MDRERHDDTDRLRVSDREREEVVNLLGKAVTEGRITLDEYSERAGAAHASQTRGELARLTTDLPDGRPASTAGALPVTEKLLAVFGNDVRAGAWQAPESIEARAVFGDCRIELHQAQLSSRVTRIEAEAIFGNVTIVVPEGTDVRLTGSAILGERKSKLTGPVTPGAPVIEVHCRAILGDVTVRAPRKRWWS
ncbi:DUF1707 SHOCT-like domain-containing protein [Micromonospora craniellae]|uniref:DUF1707 and DUF2154 domain-containing protein n=1 Tax=Micromonospora craniellae TaxID=2294034 RepID=A0A372FSC0_9ACTN|nr:DUF1707 domain-containing protein [Micromonospora craniellae]QOC91305.1 DUF1707 and DUF2154 domain-containing protein [Micromonospora craniellae]RFS43677.1 DUF1707 and DUF2154 domain-containing protein [Micromonospora craniellae]